MEKNEKDPKAKMILLACMVKNETKGYCTNVKHSIQYGQILD